MSLPRPLPLHDVVLTMDNVDDYKRYDCRTYARCLDVAATWPQFTCNGCTAYEPLPADHPSRRIFARVGVALLNNSDK